MNQQWDITDWTDDDLREVFKDVLTVKDITRIDNKGNFLVIQP